MLRQNMPILYPRTVEPVLMALNIEFEIMFESFAHNFTRLHILYTHFQNDLVTKYTYFIA